MSVPVDRVSALSFHPLYEPPEILADGSKVRRLNLNESPFPPSPAVIAAMTRAAALGNRYPDGEARALIEALAAGSGIPPERIFVGAGSNELLAASAEISLDPGDQMLAPLPAFPTYAKLARLRGAEFVGVPLRGNGRIDVPAMLAAVTPRTRLAFFSSPHNPTGGIMTAEDILRLVQELPEHVMLHFDEAYYEFGRAAGAPDALPILSTRKGPWISTRTFSKAYGMAGVRVGYGFAGTPELALAIRKVRPNFSLSRMALAGGVAALAEPGASAALVALILKERDRMATQLRPAGFTPLPGAANFLALLPPPGSPNLVDRLRDAGIYITDFVLGETRALRITIGDAEDTNAVVSALLENADAPR